MNRFALAAIFAAPLLVTAQVPKEKIVIDYVRGNYAHAAAVVSGDMETKEKEMVVKVAEVWKGDGLAAGSEIRIPRENQADSKAVVETHSRVLVFFFLQPAISSHEMLYFTGEHLRIYPELTMESLKQAMKNPSNQPSQSTTPSVTPPAASSAEATEAKRQEARQP